MPKPWIAVLSLLVLCLPLAAQNVSPPDLSGTWVLNIANSTLAKDSTLTSETIDIANKKSAIVFRYRADGKKSTATYSPDGQYRVMRDLSSTQLLSRARWQGSALLIESILEIKMPRVELNVTGLKPIVNKWTLTPDGRTLTHEADDGKEVFVYDKQ